MTPFKKNGDVDLDAIPNYVQHLIDQKVNAVFVNGTTAEGLSLTIDERKKLAEKWVEATRGKLKTIIHCGAIAIRDAQDLAKHAESIGADAIAAIPSFYFPPRNCGDLVQSVADIASAAPKTPFIYYHTVRTHLNVEMATFCLQARERIPTFAGIKWADENAAEAYKVFTKIQADDFVLMWAIDDSFLAALTMGMESFNGSSYTFTGLLAAEITEAYKKGDFKKADAGQLKLKKIVDVLEQDGEWLERHKAAAEFAGLSMGPPRLPNQSLAKDKNARFREELTKVGFFDVMKVAAKT